MVIGWDCASPDLVLGTWKNDLPNINKLMRTGVSGPLRSTDPPITVPAWTAMMSSRNPGVLGFYGFRNRHIGTYDGKWIATSGAIKVKRAWEIASEAGKRVCVLNVPQTFPIKPVNGMLVSCFLTPSTDSNFVYPPELKEEVQRVSDGYIIDVDNFRTDDKQWLLDEIYRMTDKQFEVAKHFLQQEKWDFFMQVCMGPDRLGHGFWKYCDPNHPKYEPGNPFETSMIDYYRHIDAQLGELMALAGDDVTVLVVSDHGGKAMSGSLNLNEWLLDEARARRTGAQAGGDPRRQGPADGDQGAQARGPLSCRRPRRCAGPVRLLRRSRLAGRAGHRPRHHLVLRYRDRPR
jgi:predicted AlkP superfamily phosphohydrolase/phosphomutase